MARILRSLVVASAFALASTAALAAGDPSRGEVVFKTQCATCHSVKPAAKPMRGPSLLGVIGRPSGSLPGFTYSKAMKSANLVWTPDTVAKYVSAPAKVVPGNAMPFAGLGSNTNAIDDLIAFLSSAH